MSKPDGGPAFPRLATRAVSVAGNFAVGDPGSAGMSIRDYFAAHALSFLVVRDVTTMKRDDELTSALAEGAYKLADAMLAERAKP